MLGRNVATCERRKAVIRPYLDLPCLARCAEGVMILSTSQRQSSMEVALQIATLVSDDMNLREG